MTLLMRDLENQEKGMEKGLEKGMEKGMEKGIYGMVSAFRDLNVPDDIILKKLQEKFSLTKTEAKKYLQ